MIEPVELNDFFITFLSAALVILFGAAYAGLFAWSKLRGKAGLMIWAFVCYAALAATTFLLAQATHLSGHRLGLQRFLGKVRNYAASSPLAGTWFIKEVSKPHF